MPGAKLLLAASLVGVLAGASVGGRAAQAQTAPAQPAAPAPPPAIDPGAIAALQKMSAFLRGLQVFEVQSETTTDDVLASGQKVQYGGVVDMKVKRPNRLRVDVASDRKNERIFYDGNTFTVFQPSVGYYASFMAPPTLRELVDVLEQRYGVDLPMADLFRLGADEAQIAGIRGATMVGWSTIKGAVCAHYAFHQADIDWEIWIQGGAQPLPRRLVITTTTDRSKPQYASTLTWNLGPTFDDQAFLFMPPPNSQRIDFDIQGGGPATRSIQGGGTP
jgi:hypothetical protein